MFNLQKITVRKTERAILLRNGDIERVLRPGQYRFPALFDTIEVERSELAQPLYIGVAADYLLANPEDPANAEFTRVELSDTEAGLLFENGSLTELLPPATRRLYWKSANVRVAVVSLDGEGELTADLLATISQSQLKRRAVVGLPGVLQVQVPQFHVGLLSIDGKLVRQLGPGAYGF